MRESHITHSGGEMAAHRAPAVEPIGVPALPAAVLVAASRKALQCMIRTLAVWHQRTRQRRQLLELDDRLLKDIGLSHADAYGEWRKPFWKP